MRDQRKHHGKADDGDARCDYFVGASLPNGDGHSGLLHGDDRYDNLTHQQGAKRTIINSYAYSSTNNNKNYTNKEGEGLALIHEHSSNNASNILYSTEGCGKGYNNVMIKVVAS